MLKPESLGAVPSGLPKYHGRFLSKIRDSIEIMNGRQVTQSARVETLTVAEVGTKPRSQVVTFGDLYDVLVELGLV